MPYPIKFNCNIQKEFILFLITLKVNEVLTTLFISITKNKTLRSIYLYVIFAYIPFLCCWSIIFGRWVKVEIIHRTSTIQRQLFKNNFHRRLQENILSSCDIPSFIEYTAFLSSRKLRNFSGENSQLILKSLESYDT